MQIESPDASDSGQPGSSDSYDAAKSAAVCDICNRSYSRMEHLIRHVRSHTQEKPYACPVCRKSFARTDVLKRHYVSHLEDEAPQKRQRLGEACHQRASKACIACAETKVRCQGGNPCQRCLTKNIPCQVRSRAGKQQPRRVSTAQSTRSTDTQPSNVTRGNHSFPEQQRPEKNGLHMPAEQTTEAALVANTATTDGDTIADGRSQTHAQNNSLNHSLTDLTQASLDESGLVASTAMDFSPGHGNSQITDFLMSVMLTADAGEQPITSLDPLQPFSPADVLDFTGESFHFASPQPPINLARSDSQRLDACATVQDLDRNGIECMTPPVLQPAPLQNGIILGAQAFQNSLWSFNPSQKDQWKSKVAQLSESPQSIDAVCSEFDTGSYDAKPVMVTSSTRNKIMSLVLSLSDHFSVDATASLLSLFPSRELLTSLTNRFLASHAREIDTFVHVPTFDPNEQIPELLVGMISSAALTSTLPPVHEFGSLLHEAHRELNARLASDDNRNVRLLAPLQSIALQLGSALWSGDRRNMEIAEGIRNSLVTMIRRTQIFNAYNVPHIEPEPGDSPHVTEEKWRNWVKYESFKRLGIHALITDVQCSMSFLIPPLISPTELRLALPASRDLWEAKTSTKWRDIFLAKAGNSSISIPSVRSCIQEFGLVLPLKELVDPQLTSLVILSGLWPPIFCFRQSAQLRSDRGSQSSLILNSLYQEAKDVQEAFKVVFSEWCDDLGPSTLVLHERMLMCLHVSLEDVQVFGGKAGVVEARRTIPMLTAWMKRRESRQAVWHAGQLLRAARRYPDSLPAPSMIAVYHSSLVLWAYSAVLSIECLAVPTSDMFFQEGPVKVTCLDGDNDAQHFLALGCGTPVITLHNHSTEEQAAKYVPIRDGRAVMTSVVDFILTKNGAPDTKDCLPLVANLGRLMLELGYAAGRMSRECCLQQANEIPNGCAVSGK